MRSQTLFEKLSQGASQQVFVYCFIALRIAIGLGCFYLAFTLGQASVESTSTLEPSLVGHMQLTDLNTFKTMVIPFLMLMGTSFTLGILMRPVVSLAIVILIVNGLTSGSSEPIKVFVEHILLALGLLLFAVGGAGYVLGLDGMISRNIRRPNLVTKFLFG